MTVTINNQKKEIAAGTTLAALAEELHLPPTGVAVALNNRVMPRTEWQKPLSDGDTIVIINASCGG